MNVPLITIPNFRPKCSKSIPVFRPKRLKNHTLWGGTYLYTSYRGVPPSPGYKQQNTHINKCNLITLIKVPMKWKIIAAYLKAFKKNLNGIFLFGISFFILQMLKFFVLCKLGKWWRHPVCNLKGKILNKEYLWKYKSSVLQTWHHKCSFFLKSLSNTVSCNYFSFHRHFKSASYACLLFKTT